MTPIDPAFLRPRLLHRANDSHKGDYGHLLIVAGCETMPGAAVLATGAALRSGCGLVTLHSTGRALQAAVNNYPSAILSEIPEENPCLSPRRDIRDYTAIAVGPGLGRDGETQVQLLELFSGAALYGIPLILDADALNILSETPDWQGAVPVGSILTPHAGELRRLFPGKSVAETEAAVTAFCHRCSSVLVWKGYHTRVFTPEGDCLVNTTGNPGMAKGGSGNVLTGLIGGLVARGYDIRDAAALGVWIHGYAGDCLSGERTAEGYDSRDLADSLWKGFRVLYQEEEQPLSDDLNRRI